MDSYAVTIATWVQLAERYQDKFMDLDIYNDTYDAFCSLLPQAAQVLEIGCGPGNITRYLLSKRPDFKIRATDVAPSMVALAQQNNPTADCRVMDAREIAAVDKKFDAIVCGFCLPYLAAADVAKLLLDGAALLEKGGVLYCSTIEGDYNCSGYETGSSGDLKAYVYYYAEAQLRAMLQAASFELLQLIRIPYTKPDGTASTHLVVMARR